MSLGKVARERISGELSLSIYLRRQVPRDWYPQRQVAREGVDLSLGIVVNVIVTETRSSSSFKPRQLGSFGPRACNNQLWGQEPMELIFLSPLLLSSSLQFHFPSRFQIHFLVSRRSGSLAGQGSTCNRVCGRENPSAVRGGATGAALK
ncbi:hypothetical protein Tco_1436296, partial [Tanacetum coccineum]